MADTTRRKVGRPSSGKKGFCIRMHPNTHKRLTQVAQQAGFDTLGDWLDEVSMPIPPMTKTHEHCDWDGIPLQDLCLEFRRQAAQAKSALAELHELVDLRPVIVRDPENMEALAELKRTHATLQRLAANV